ncbi:aminopeptidase [Thiohalophilus thiocyanatoxydans]|uniref:Putative aminopeptidase n=1 Tax=Thiohalophilus thiocyanatoxydans TaxID=381308 RepID=A0A4R8J0Q1_9GAMM|nr:aminopeptidase [Thiohalophilus thiocyanatoxydans]TDY03877.1 putative aminopeptidase [Thiohalophilus thiocyanatoxydans]
MRTLLLLFVIVITLPGCSTLSYYLGAVNGHAEILNRQRPVGEVVKDPATSETVRDALLQIQQARRFAVEALLLPDNDSYRYYADIDRPYAVWNVIATPELSVEPRQWCFLLVGCFSYRGYFSEHKADAYARQLQEQGDDTHVAGARAYSTLGWFDDPLLNTMLLHDEAHRLGVLFHELAHQKIYIDDDPAFNEGFAVFVQQVGVRRWFEAQGMDEAADRYQQTVQRRARFHGLLLETREKLAKLYASEQPDRIKREQKRQHFADLKQAYRQLKRQWNGYGGYDEWMQQPLNNAHLALVATYREHVARFERLLEQHNGDLAAFYTAVERLAKLPPGQRKAALLNNVE